MESRKTPGLRASRRAPSPPASGVTRQASKQEVVRGGNVAAYTALSGLVGPALLLASASGTSGLPGLRANPQGMTKHKANKIVTIIYKLYHKMIKDITETKQQNNINSHFFP